MNKKILIDEFEISYWDNEIEGPAVLFVHGNSSSVNSFEKQFIDPMLGRFRMVAIDLPGHGGSSRRKQSGEPYSMGLYSRILKKFVVRLKLSAVVFVGHSLGGHLLLEASSLLDQAKGFFIFGAAPIKKPANFAEAFLPSPAAGSFFKKDLSDREIKEWCRACFAPSFEVPENISNNIRSADPLVREEMGQSLGSLNYEDEVRALEKIRVPVAIIHGVLEPLINLNYLNGLKVHDLWNNEVTLLSNAGHSPHWEVPELFNRNLKLFVESIK